MKDMQNLGGWSSYREMTDSEKKVFAQTMNLQGVNYTPLCVATQVVSGTNYSFFCEAIGVYPGAKPYNVLVKIYVPSPGTPSIKEVKTVELF